MLSVQYGDRQFLVSVKKRDCKNFSITVHPNLEITVNIPVRYELENIYRLLKKRASWIAKQVDYFEQFHPLQPKRKYVSGETHCYLGRQYRLKIREADAPQLKLIGRFFNMHIPSPNDNKQAETLMQAWYFSHAKALMDKRMMFYLPEFLERGAAEPVVKLRRMQKRWGSCNNKMDVIMLNSDLIKAPIYCIDYVIVHELCHLLCSKHDNKFYRLLDSVLPEWKRCKNRLERVVI